MEATLNLEHSFNFLAISLAFLLEEYEYFNGQTHFKHLGAELNEGIHKNVGRAWRWEN